MRENGSPIPSDQGIDAEGSTIDQRGQESISPTAKDLSSLTNFYADRFSAEVPKAATPPLRSLRKKEASQMTNVHQLLKDMANRGMHSVDEMMAEVSRKQDNITENLSREKDPAKIQTLDEQSRTLQRASTFLESNKSFNPATQADFRAWRAQHQPAREQKGASKTFGKDASVERSEIEKQREPLIQMVLRDGGVILSTSIEKEISPNHSAGFQSLTEPRFIGANPYLGSARTIEYNLVSLQDSHRGKSSGREILEEHARGELVGFNRSQKSVTEPVKIPEAKDWLGRIKSPGRIEQRAMGKTEPVLHSSVVQGGKNEPLVYLTYLACGPDRYNNDLGWKDYSNRYGQQITAEIALPESAAAEIQHALEKDPALIRHIIERVVKEKLIPQNPERWETPPNGNPILDGLRPPYEKWDQAPGGGRIYIQPPDAERGWHDEFDRKIMAA